MGQEDAKHFHVEKGEMDSPIKIDLDSLPAEGYAEAEIQKDIHILDDSEKQALERKYMWKLDSIILPTISTLYFFEYLDRGNVAARESIRRSNFSECPPLSNLAHLNSCSYSLK